MEFLGFYCSCDCLIDSFLFATAEVLSPKEMEARYKVWLEEYIEKIGIEVKVCGLLALSTDVRFHCDL